MPIVNDTKEVRFSVRELRAEKGDDGERYFTGYAAVFNSLSADMGGGWKEVIRTGAFTKSLAAKREIRHLVNHDKSLLLGNTLAGTTEIWEDEVGLRFRTLCADRTYETDLIKSIERGDASKNSFSFRVVGKNGQRWSRTDDAAYELRELLEVEIFEVSTLTCDPAYSATSVELSYRDLFPTGIPAEIRSHVPALEQLMDSAISDASVADFPAPDDPCLCPCSACTSGDCPGCEDPDCNDPFCDCTHGAKARAQAAKLQPMLSFTERRAVLGNTRRVTEKVKSRLADWNTRREARAAGIGVGVREFRSAVDATTGVLEIYMYGDIGEDMCGDGITVKGLRKQLAEAVGYTSIQVRINSFGGDAFEGVAIYNLLRAQNKPVRTVIDGIAASAASIIAMAGKEIYMPMNAMMMIHNASTAAYGNAVDLRTMADVLQKISDSIAQTYVTQTKKKLAYIQGLLAAESWLSAEDCLKDGFATSIGDAPSPGVVGEEDDDTEVEVEIDIEENALQMARESRALRSYQNTPARFLASPTSTTSVPTHMETRTASTLDTTVVDAAIQAATVLGDDVVAVEEPDTPADPADLIPGTTPTLPEEVVVASADPALPDHDMLDMSDDELLNIQMRFRLASSSLL